ncbi:hypothetical protein Vadar_013928 [Vaccinium darrowii]|uniref:Uncharacterized protein n=1 Tax=Vaccinium darrowii TaxID=229202 RepID=A0ACB7Z3P8_9ERIC|nr:hypothetical protein Vadar_013928 [Vaccinium darrowii]
MALCNSKLSSHFHVQQSQPILFLNFISWLTIFLFLPFPFANSISFNFSSFNPNQPEIQFQGDAIMQPYHGNDGSSEEMLQLTKYPLDGTLPTSSVGRATYSTPIHIWDSKTGNLADFNTHFSFIIAPLDRNSPVGDGLSFFLSPQNATIPSDSAGGFLGLFNNSNTDTNNQIVAVEFDTYQNSWDPSPNHIGIDVNSIESVAYVTPDTSMANSKIANAWVDYNSTTKTLSVYLTYELNPVFQGNYDLSHVVDLSNVLPEWVSVGFSGATGTEIQVNNLISWSFDSTLGGSSDSPSVGSPSNSTSGGSPSDSTLGGSPSTMTGHKTNQLVIYLPVGIGSLICGVGLFWFLKLKKIVLPWQSSSQEVKQVTTTFYLHWQFV